MEIISVNIAKGGCGKTTTVQILGEILTSKYQKKVLCIDTDPQCNLTIVSGINPITYQKHNTFTLLKNQSTLADCIVSTKLYDIIPGSTLLAYANNEFNKQNKEYLLKNKLSTANYDFILIDTPPNLNLTNIMSLTASNKVLIPTESSYLSMVGLNQLFQTITSVKKHSNAKLSIAGILLIKYNYRTNLNGAVSLSLQKMASQIQTKVFSAKIRETIKIKEAQSIQKPISDWCPHCSAYLDYINFTNEFLQK